MLPTRFAFHAMLGVSIAVAVTGIALGAEARRAEDSREGSSHTAAAQRSARARISVEQSVAPPFPIAPRFGAAVLGRPVLAWRLEEGTDVRGEQVALPAPWPSGVWYWRLRGRDGSTVGDRATPTWMLYVTDAATAS
jgi:hypothetical protein